jgi:hypothetical protein
MPGQFLNDLWRNVAISKERDIAIPQTMEDYLIAIFVKQVYFRNR